MKVIVHGFITNGSWVDHWGDQFSYRCLCDNLSWNTPCTFYMLGL